MKVLVVMRHSGYVRNFESTLRMLCDRGHTVHLAFQNPETHWLLDPADVAQQLSDTYPRFSRGSIPTRADTLGHAARDVRFCLDYLRYLEPEYQHASKLRERAMREVPGEFVERTKAPVFRTALARRALRTWLRMRHRAVPTDPRIDAFLDVQRPDLLVVTPLIESGAPQAEYLRSARALGIRTAYCVASWDNLTNKGLIHGPVDLVTVWNEAMKREALDLHGIPADRVVVTGAQPFDHWFEWEPNTTRDQFCGGVGLPADRPYLLYMCSSKFIAPDEAVFVRRWVESLRRSSHGGLKDVGVLIRPHPQNADQWESADLSGLGAVVVWPRAGASPADARNRAEYFDTIYHSAAVVGVNTTAEIESAIVGRSVYTLLVPEFRGSQEGTPHFNHLRTVNGGLLHLAADFAEHERQLAAAIQNPQASDDRSRRFIEAFVRPRGLKVPATPRLVKALEKLADRPAPQPERAPWWAPMFGSGLLAAGARRQRAACLEVEQRAARRAAKEKKAAAAAPAEAPAVAAAGPVVAAAVDWGGLAARYRNLSLEDKLRFGHATADCRPAGTSAVPNGERLDYPHADILLRVTSKAERKRLRSCAKEPFTIDWIHQYIEDGDVLFDIGANVGAYSLIAALKPGGGARVFAFEPSYVNVAALCANIILNQAADRITPIPLALSDSETLSTFDQRALDPGSARHIPGDGRSPEGPTVYRQPVLTSSLDAFVDRFGLPCPNHIKLDVDGGEMAVLAGAARALASPALRTVLVEVSTDLWDEVAGELRRRGMTLEARVPVANKAGQSPAWYGLFTRGDASPDDAVGQRPVHLRPR